MADSVVFVLTALLVAVAAAAFDVPAIPFDEGYSQLFGEGNLVRSPDGRSVRIMLNRYSGSGFISSESYLHGFFSASIKLPAGYTAGVVVAFYLSNGDVFEKNHDELDFEFLGNTRGKEWRVQTNVYGNGSTSRGREERYLLPFDPTEEAHRYSILWTPNYIIFYVDDVPIREVVRSEAMGGDYPSKPMSVYATIWDGSTWATDGGKYKVSYKYAPFVAEFSDLVLRGCRADSAIQLDHPSSAAAERCADAELELMTADYAVVTPQKRAAMRRFRERYMTYTVCYDAVRYAATFPECKNSPPEQERFWDWGESKFVAMRRRRSNKRRPGAKRQADA
ncbi:putative xyloglucan endotransglucosylase/hydrolase protein 30 [Ananas comosus]|uniref:Xyloglucan endotransglucosylase/hydrolase n=1 Tax=Ananas comosus TaxID=4615 RepID=A0A199W5Y8_ANACO|nr:putative xyloglucan endotransglucosylase/hydrolase protein 30 [Ananas comosus]